MTVDQNRGRDYWLELFSKTDLPVLGGVVHELESVTGKDNSTALQLADVILKDPSLTSRVLKVANCVIYNPTINNPITTISRAVVQLGIAGVKSIYTSVVLIDKLLSEQSPPYLLDGIVHAINAAVQSRNLMEQASGKASEEVFIAALLYRLGELAFWCFGAEQADQLSDTLEHNEDNSAALIELQLGASFHSLSSGLAERWELGAILKEALNKPSPKKPEAKAVQFGDRLCELLVKAPDSAELKALLSDIADFCKTEPKEIDELIARGTTEATSELKAFGVHQMHQAAKLAQSKKEKPITLSPDPQFQLNMLRDLDVMVKDKCDINTLFHTVAEGIHLGVGLERVAILLCDTNRSKVQAKHVLGKGTENWREQLIIPITKEHPGALMQCAQQRQAIIIGDTPQTTSFSKLEQKLFGNTPAQAAPIIANNRLIGVIYADRDGNQQLADEQRSAFQYIVQQANTSLEQLISNRSH
jgi:HD-like signal output (HDOD) protein